MDEGSWGPQDEGMADVPFASDVLVLGGGASGMIAAWRAASLGHRVMLVEANARLAMKVRISGGGKCNLTHEGTASQILKAFRPDQARFLRPALHAFGSEAIRQLMSDLGVATCARENGRVFPEDRPGSAEAVVQAFERLLDRPNLRVATGLRARGLVGHAPRLEGIQLEDGQVLRAPQFILATGGASYPKTGTRGEVLGWLKALGVPVLAWAPALAPIPLKQHHPEWEGVALRGGILRLQAGPKGKRLAEQRGDLLFTRSGITGPAVLELSRETEVLRRSGEAWLTYACVSAASEQVDLELQEAQRTQPHLAARNWLQRWIPERIVQAEFERLGLSPDQRLKDLGKASRRALVEVLTAFPLGEPGPVELAKGEVCAGGVDRRAVDPRTMRVQGFENLRVCGELLDIDGPVGGYNLQAAFSTGFIAGSMA